MEEHVEIFICPQSTIKREMSDLFKEYDMNGLIVKDAQAVPLDKRDEVIFILKIAPANNQATK